MIVLLAGMPDNLPNGQLAPSTNRPLDKSPLDKSPPDKYPHGQLSPWITRPMNNLPHRQLASWTLAPRTKIAPWTKSHLESSPHGQLVNSTTRPMDNLAGIILHKRDLKYIFTQTSTVQSINKFCKMYCSWKKPSNFAHLPQEFRTTGWIKKINLERFHLEISMNATFLLF